MSGVFQVAGIESVGLVVDVSAIIQWHVEEPQTANSLRFLDDRALTLHVPDLMFSEVGNIAWKKVRQGKIDLPRAREIITLVAVAPLVFHPSHCGPDVAFFRIPDS